MGLSLSFLVLKIDRIAQPLTASDRPVGARLGDAV
jgi:hypothetical protein